MSHLTAGGRTALILFGSETGNAQDIAGDVERMASRLRFSTRISSLDSIDVDTLARFDVVLVVVSTTGQGELPRNARVFWKTILKKRLPPTYFEHVKIALFGLGDSSYPKYNWAALKLHKRLVQLGARDVVPLGQGDEQHAEGYDATFLPWLDSLRQALIDSIAPDVGLEPLPDGALLEPQWLLELKEDDDLEISSTTQTDAQDNNLHQGEASRRISPVAGDSKWLHAVLQTNERVTPVTHWQDVRRLSFTVRGSVPYSAGDLITIYPKNATDDVEEILRLMDWSSMADKHVQFMGNPRYHTNSMLPPPSFAIAGNARKMNFRSMLTNCLDLNTIPRRSFFAMLAHFTTDEFQRNRLLEFAMPSFVEELYDYTTRPRRSVLEVLQEFHTVKIPWQWAAVVLPELRGRQFSIASGGWLKADIDNITTRFELLVAIVKYRTVIRKIRRGVCTRYLESLPVGTSLLVSLHQGSLRATRADISRPIVMVGPGTGVAPMRSLIWERQAWSKELAWDMDSNDDAGQENQQSVGRSVLFFGCRNEGSDYFFRQEWEDLEKEKLLQVYAAFSRDEKQKNYVQDLIKVNGQLVYSLLGEAKGIIYVCGSSGKMPLAVRDVLVEIFQRFGNLDQAKAELYLTTMEKEGRYKQETW